MTAIVLVGLKLMAAEALLVAVSASSRRFPEVPLPGLGATMIPTGRSCSLVPPPLCPGWDGPSLFPAPSSLDLTLHVHVGPP